MLENNNPGNLRNLPNETWRGQVNSGTGSMKIHFRHSSWGIRAIAIAIENYAIFVTTGGPQLPGYDAAHRWATFASQPGDPRKNEAAKRFALELKRVTSGNRSISDYNLIYALVDAAIILEQGENPYTIKEMISGLARAGIEVPAGSLVNSRILWGSIVAGVSTSLGAALDGSDLPFLMEFFSIQYPEYYDIAMHGITGLGLLAVLWARVDDQKTRI